MTSKPGGSAARRLGPYEFVGRLGAGGMGEVYRARDTRLGREVAIKVLPAEASSNEDRLRRFEKEAQAASSLNHPNIVTIYEIERIDSTSFIAMELIDGKTLRDVVSEGALPVRNLLGIATQIADGLARAHSAGIVHRDLKPENVMVTKEGLVKILDFGLSKLVRPDMDGGQATEAATVSAGTKPGIVMGTVGYMSPEQASGHPVDFRSDQFSLGSILYEMATGKAPFRRATAAQTLAAIIQDEPESIAVVNPKVPVPLRWVIEQCLAKDPRERYASTEDLARELGRVRDHLSDLSAVQAVSPAATRNKRRAASAIAVVTVLAVLGVGYVLSRHTGDRPSPSFHRLTFRRGHVAAARFSADGQTIVYDASWDGKPPELFTTRLGAAEGRPLGLGSAVLSAVSSRGEMAFLLRPVTTGYSPGGTLAVAPLGGGAPRVFSSTSRGQIGLPTERASPSSAGSGSEDDSNIPRGRFSWRFPSRPSSGVLASLLGVIGSRSSRVRTSASRVVGSP